MATNPRKFQAGADPFGRVWTAELCWLQNAISIRHADAVDVKWDLRADDGAEMVKVVALRHPDLLRLSQQTNRPLSDPWCIRLAGEHIRFIIETWEDAEKTIVSPSWEQLVEYGKKTLPAVALASH